MLTPRNDRLVVKPMPREASKILHVIDRAYWSLGEVIAVGPGKRDHKGRIKPLDCKPGDIVAYGSNDPAQSWFKAGMWPVYSEQHEDGTVEDFLVLQEGDICGVFATASDI